MNTEETQEMRPPVHARINRRALLTGTVALAASAPTYSHALAQAAPAEPSAHFTKAVAELSRGRKIRPGRIVFDIPRLAESGNSVQLKFRVESPMTSTDHAKTVHLLSEQNPIATIARFHFSPASGRCEAETYVRLATTQNVHAVAEMSDGSLWGAKAEAVVLLAACLDGG
jgi:sulfur-oxidizing protein SoxY